MLTYVIGKFENFDNSVKLLQISYANHKGKALFSKTYVFSSIFSNVICLNIIVLKQFYLKLNL